jgi:ABC-2 type transport system permease protein
MHSPGQALTRLAVRTIRTSALVVAVTAAALVYAGLKAVTTSAAVRSLDLSSLVDNPAIRALYGRAYDLSVPGGFVVWRYGQTVTVIVALWASLTITRLLRGDEEKGRSDLVLAGQVTPTGLIATDLTVVAGACLLGTLTLTGVFAVMGESLGASALFSAGTGLVMLAFAAVGAVTSQLFTQRRRAAGTAGLAVAAGYGIRMLSDGSAIWSWTRWVTPFGWLEALQPFAGNHPAPLALLVALPVLLLMAAIALARRRDVGEGVLRDSQTAEPRRTGLRHAGAFAARERVGGVIAWSVGLGAYGLVIGVITGAFVDFIATSASFAQYAKGFGMSDLASPAGFVATMDSLMAVVLAAYAISSVRLLWDDEEDRRLDPVFAAPISRLRWLGAATAATGGAVIVMTLVVAFATWTGVNLGSSSLSLHDSLAGIGNTLPLVVVFTGLAVLCHGVRPQFTTAAVSGLLVASYLLSFLAPALHWPNWVVSLSPFHHLALVPVQPVAWAATAAMVGIGLMAGGLGAVAYRHRDLA